MVVIRASWQKFAMQIEHISLAANLTRLIPIGAAGSEWWQELGEQKQAEWQTRLLELR
jgi:hypothetical protein